MNIEKNNKIRGNNRKKFGKPVEKICEQCGNESFIPKLKNQWHCRYCNWINGIHKDTEVHT